MGVDLHHRKFLFSDSCTVAEIWQKEDLLTVVDFLATFLFVYNYPTTARFLTQKEKEYVPAQLKGDSDATGEERFTWPCVI